MGEVPVFGGVCSICGDQQGRREAFGELGDWRRMHPVSPLPNGLQHDCWCPRPELPYQGLFCPCEPPGLSSPQPLQSLLWLCGSWQIKWQPWKDLLWLWRFRQAECYTFSKVSPSCAGPCKHACGGLHGPKCLGPAPKTDAGERNTHRF